MLDFNDLEFITDSVTKQASAKINFVNGYGIIVHKITNEIYDALITKNDLEYNKTHIKNSSLKSITTQQISETMRIIQNFGRESY